MESEIKTPVKLSPAVIGERLKKVREDKALTIGQVQKKTKIHSDVLIALEDGRCDEMFGAMYVKGFLKQYSVFLGLDPVDIVKEYFGKSAALQEKVFIAPKQPNPKASPKPKPVVSGDVRKTNIYLLVVYAAISLILTTLFIFGIYLLGKTLVGFFKPPEKQGKIILVQTKSRAKPKPAAAAPKKKTKLAAKPAAKNMISKNASLQLVIRVKAPVFVKVRRDGVAIFERVLPRDAVESVKAKDRIELYVARAEAIELVLNGKSLGSPGKGIIKDLEITRKGIRIG